MDIQVPLLAAKALLLLLLFAFIYSVMRRGVGDLRSVPEESKGPAKRAAAGGRGGYVSRDRNAGSELVVEDSEVLAPETRFVVRDGSTSIGRSPESDIVLKSDDYASGRHARLTRHGGLLYVEDTESTNGTYVNDRKTVGATPLREGDTIKVGSTTFRYTG
jgi:hypothetical protein